MKAKITYFLKYLKCGGIAEYILRDTTNKWVKINSSITDEDVHRFIAFNVESPLKSEYCDKCGIHTLQQYVGCDY